MGGKEFIPYNKKAVDRFHLKKAADEEKRAKEEAKGKGKKDKKEQPKKEQQ